MVVVEFRKVKCDNCSKEETIEDSGHRPDNWLEVSVVEWFGSTGTGRLNNEVCSEKCVLELMKKLKEIPPKPTTHIF